MNKHTRSVSLIDGHTEDRTDAEVIKALECLKGVEVECIGCAYQKCGYPMCREEVALDALDLIKRKDAKIAELQHKISELHKLIPKMIKEAKSEAMKEFMAKAKFFGYYIDYPKEHRVIDEEDLDNLVKEMTEGE